MNNPLHLILAVILILLIFGYFIPYGGGPYLGTGWRGGSVLGVILIVILIFALFGRI